jgi:hypothetical protein
MARKWTLASGVGLGAALMYLLDPDRGKRRRALLRDKTVHLLHATGDTLDVALRNAAHRAHGLIARTRSVFAPQRVPDAVLAERVRSNIGHVVSHPGSVEVAVRDGRVTLAGPILAGEVDGLLARASRVRGVAGVENQLKIHEEPGGVPGLQDGIGRAGSVGPVSENSPRPGP